ncbi:MAG: hypothetical protein A4E73_01996 [Syntrophaceae bacterium PtaU1.Bin231]|nr:MAG: hypothetical protein A4E73_01996 [Syntrophaceae bacterium PtaU1.Bin231]
MSHIDMLIETLEILESAVDSRNQDKGFEAITILLMQFIEIYGDEGNMFKKMYPFLEKMKSDIQHGNFEEADIMTKALLVKLRMVNEKSAVRGD